MTLDASFTFASFVVGPSNRLAAAAAKRAADSPSAYNPVFLYAASGLGKSHLLGAIAHQVQAAHPPRQVQAESIDQFLEGVARRLEKAPREGLSLGTAYAGVDVLLLDDVQFLAGQPQAQEMLLRTLDTLTARGAQVVLASDRPPAEINDLDSRLLSRFSGGLLVDLGIPDFETRVAILRRRAEITGGALGPGVAESLGRYPFRNVRELQGALNRLLAVQDLEGRILTAQDLAEALGPRFVPEIRTGVSPRPSASSGVGVDVVSGLGRAGDARVDLPWHRALRFTAEALGRAGYGVARIHKVLADPDRAAEMAEGWPAFLLRLREDVDALVELRLAFRAADIPLDDALDALLRDPDRVDEARRRFEVALELRRPMPPLPPGPTLDTPEGEAAFPPLARQVGLRAGRSDHRFDFPVFAWSPEPGRGQAFLEAVGRSFVGLNPEARVGLLSVQSFGEDYIRALTAGVASAWRDRLAELDLLLLFGVEGLPALDRGREEFFHLFEALRQRGGRLILASTVPPADLDALEDRLRSRFEGGLVLDLGPATAPAPAPGPPEPPPLPPSR
jgi:chromosomal replication initiator protein